MTDTFPIEGVELTVLLVVSDVERSKLFYRDVLGATVYREYGGTSCVLQFQGSWLLLVTGSGPTPDKPTVTLAPPADPDVATHELTLRVPDCRTAYETLHDRGAEFLTPPVENDWETRAFFRDPDGHLLEISSIKGARSPSRPAGDAEQPATPPIRYSAVDLVRHPGSATASPSCGSRCTWWGVCRSRGSGFSSARDRIRSRTPVPKRRGTHGAAVAIGLADHVRGQRVAGPPAASRDGGRALYARVPSVGRVNGQVVSGRRFRRRGD